MLLYWTSFCSNTLWKTCRKIRFQVDPCGMFNNNKHTNCLDTTFLVVKSLCCDSFADNKRFCSGGTGLVLTAYILFFVAESPKEHPSISKAELNYILGSQENTLSRRNGLFSAVPFLIAFLTGVISTTISGHLEKNKIVSNDFLRKFWHFLSCFLYSLCLLGVYFAACDRNLSAIFSILSMGLSGVGTPGSVIVPQDMSPTFAGTLVSISYTVGWTASVMLPVIVGYLTEGMQTLEQWNKIFFISIGVVMSSGILFAVFGSAKIQPWNFVEEENVETDENRSKHNKDDKTSRF